MCGEVFIVVEFCLYGGDKAVFVFWIPWFFVEGAVGAEGFAEWDVDVEGYRVSLFLHCSQLSVWPGLSWPHFGQRRDVVCVCVRDWSCFMLFLMM